MDIKERTNQYRQQLEALLGEVSADKEAVTDPDMKAALEESEDLMTELYGLFTHIIEDEDENE